MGESSSEEHWWFPEEGLLQQHGRSAVQGRRRAGVHQPRCRAALPGSSLRFPVLCSGEVLTLQALRQHSNSAPCWD